MKTPSLIKCLGAMLYDSFILFSLLILATALALILSKGSSLLPYRFLFLFYLFSFCGLFLSYCWHKSGQTLGMLAWKIKIVELNGKPLNYKRAMLRYLMSFISLLFFGAGFLWRLFDKDSQFLHDRMLGTRLIQV